MPCNQEMQNVLIFEFFQIKRNEYFRFKEGILEFTLCSVFWSCVPRAEFHISYLLREDEQRRPHSWASPDVMLLVHLPPESLKLSDGLLSHVLTTSTDPAFKYHLTGGHDGFPL